MQFAWTNILIWKVSYYYLISGIFSRGREREREREKGEEGGREEGDRSIHWSGTDY
jgi:hypothetical protein